MRFIISIIALTFLFSLSFSQTAIFQKDFGDAGWQSSVTAIQTSDGGYAVSGSTNMWSSTGDIFLMKLNSAGDTTFIRTYGLPGKEDDGSAVIQTLDNGYLISGTVDVSGNAAPVLIKTNSIGDTLWVKEWVGGTCLLRLPDKGFVLITSGSRWITKVDSAGNVLWIKDFLGYPLQKGTRTKDGGFIFTGYTNTYASGGASDYDCILVKSDSLGNIQWSKVYGTPNSIDQGANIYQTMDGGYALIGATDLFDPINKYNDVLVIKTDSIGNIKWNKTYGGPYGDAGTAIQETIGTVGFFLICETYGFQEPSPQHSCRTGAIKIDNNGNEIWAKMYGAVTSNQSNSNDLADNLWRTSDGGFLLSGVSQSFDDGSWDAWLVKADANGVSGCNETSASLAVRTPTLVVGSGGTDSSVISPSSPISLTVSKWHPKDSLLCYGNAGVEQNNALANTVLIFPNPTSGLFIIEIEEGQGSKGELEIYNLMGEKVYSSMQLLTTYAIDISSQPPGIYFLKITSQDGSSAVKKIIKE